MSEKLLPCPFCGGKAKQFTKEATGNPSGDNGFRSMIMCMNSPECAASIVRWALRKEWSAESAISAWNRRVDRWIPVSERLPKIGEAVLVWSRLKKYIDIRIFWGRGAESVWREHYTHWMPLPEPPEGVD